MRLHHSTSWILSLGLLGGLAGNPATAEALLQDATGKDSLEKWTAFTDPPIEQIVEVWKLRDGVLTCRGTPQGYLYTLAKYSDFELSLQWRWSPDSKPGKGGVLFRMTGQHKIWPKCLEVQLNTGGEGDFVGLDGFPLSGPADRLKSLDHPQFGKLTFLSKAEAAVKPAGQWNQLDIVAKGGVVTQRLNGVQVNEARDCEKTAGPILLTSEGDAIQFRNIQLKTP